MKNRKEKYNESMFSKKLKPIGPDGAPELITSGYNILFMKSNQNYNKERSLKILETNA